MLQNSIYIFFITTIPLLFLVGLALWIIIDYGIPSLFFNFKLNCTKSNCQFITNLDNYFSCKYKKKLGHWLQKKGFSPKEIETAYHKIVTTHSDLLKGKNIELRYDILGKQTLNACIGNNSPNTIYISLG